MFLTVLFSTLLVITSTLLVILILLRRGTGGGLTDMFGGGISQSAQSSALANRNLTFLTVVIAAVWAASIFATGLFVSSGSTGA